jgi:hypothetical protein
VRSNASDFEEDQEVEHNIGETPQFYYLSLSHRYSGSELDKDSITDLARNSSALPLGLPSTALNH